MLLIQSDFENGIPILAEKSFIFIEREKEAQRDSLSISKTENYTRIFSVTVLVRPRNNIALSNSFNVPYYMFDTNCFCAKAKSWNLTQQ